MNNRWYEGNYQKQVSALKAEIKKQLANYIKLCDEAEQIADIVSEGLKCTNPPQIYGSYIGDGVDVIPADTGAVSRHVSIVVDAPEKMSLSDFKKWVKNNCQKFRINDVVDSKNHVISLAPLGYYINSFTIVL